MAGPARQAHALYILGDLFEYWAGDDDLGDPFNTRMADVLKAYTAAGHALFFAPGNRDFLMGPDFFAYTGMHCLSDPACCQIEGQDYILSHGDGWCTDDTSYQEFRTMVRLPEWQKAFFMRTLEQRKALIENLRVHSEQIKNQKGYDDIMDVNEKTIKAVFKAHPKAIIIHGHTHRPGCVEHRTRRGLARRFVLPDWREEEVAYLALDKQKLDYVRFWPAP